MSEVNNNLFFDTDADLVVDDIAVDLSNISQAEIIPESCVLMRLEIESAGFQRQFASGQIIDDEDTGIDATLVVTSKRLIDRKYTEAITKLDNRMRSDIHQIGMRPKFLGKGNVIIPIKLLRYTLRKLSLYKEEREGLVEGLINSWEQAKSEIKERNPDLYREDEYLTVEELRDKYSVTYNIFSVSFPDTLDRIKAGVVEGLAAEMEPELRKMQEVQAKRLEEGVTEITQGLRAGLYSLVDGLEDKVKGVGTERKVFKPGFVSNMRTFLETFDAKNIGNDQELAEMVRRAKKVLSGVSPDAIRNSLDVRVKLESELGEIKNILSEQMEPMTRAASFK